MSRLICWHCSQAVETSTTSVPFGALCPHCDAYLHACKGCENYLIGKPNSCLIPGTEQVSDRETRNFCEEFAPKQAIEQNQSSSAHDVEKTLFGHLADPSQKSEFNDLFVDSD